MNSKFLIQQSIYCAFKSHSLTDFATSIFKKKKEKGKRKARILQLNTRGITNEGKKTLWKQIKSCMISIIEGNVTRFSDSILDLNIKLTSKRKVQIGIAEHFWPILYIYESVDITLPILQHGIHAIPHLHTPGFNACFLL